MDRFHSLQVFVKVVETGSFAAAARALNLSPPAATRAISTLEDRLGTRLLTRTTRSVRLTESGERFFEDSQRILVDLEEAELAAIGTHATPKGLLRVTAPVLFGRYFVTPVLNEFLLEYPEVSAETLFVDRVVNMMDEGMHVAIRIGELPDSSLTAIRVGYVRRVMFASPDYLKNNGIPQHPKDLKSHRVVQSMAMGAGQEWPFVENGKEFRVGILPQLRMNTNDAVIEAVKRGGGISRLLSYQVIPYFQDGSLKTILEEFEQDRIPIHVVHQEGRMASAKVRAFVDYMVTHLRDNTDLEG
ncbi:LysR family transcriptional regulator [Curvivirga aplysinae]|uniref:LysR family transcriptional regulator n=1 Tax=Curvivirga aplysinae TaxID=2529852 RepID=UPI0012BBB204|nr:LysR family transcriptional regulator [Curvivirga aplysinae]MTI09551.1 LysR family transcriptional regulator [Curvivirga aplysinae]